MSKRPICIGAVFLVLILLLGRTFGGMETSAQRLSGSSSIVSEKSVRVLGRVRALEKTAGGVRLYLNHISFHTESDYIKSDQTNNSKTNQNSENQNSTEQIQPKYRKEDSRQVNPGEQSLNQQSQKQKKSEEQSLKQEYQILVYLKPLSQKKYADQIQVGNWLYLSGICSLPERAGNPGQFDARLYYQPRKVLFLLEDAEILQVMDTGESWLGMLAKIRECLRLSYEAVLGERDAGILSAITLGDKSSLPKEIRNLYTEGGIAHILAISSLHITLLGMGFYRSLRKRRLSFVVSGVISGCFIFSFCLMTGMSASAERACVMYLLWLGSQAAGRSNDRLTSLSVAAVVLLLRTPEYLWDGSFLLSFGCILSLHFLIPLMERLLPVPGKIGSALRASCAIFLGTTPIVMYFFYQITPYAVFVNLVVIPCMTLLMVFGLAGSIAGLCSVFLGRIAAAPCHYLLEMFEWLCREERKLPGAVLITGRPALWQIWLYYLILAGLCVAYAHTDDERQGRNVGRILAAASLGILFLRIPPELRITFLDVGQGDGILVQSGRAAFLIDGGSSSVGDVWQYRMETAMKYYGISRLDGVFLSHGDQDHINGVEQLLETYECNLLGNNAGGITVEQIFLADRKEADEKVQKIRADEKVQKISADEKVQKIRADEKVQKIRAEAKARDIPVRSFPGGASVSVGEMKLTCLYPDGAQGIGDENENSMVLLLEQGEFSALFTGDLEGRGEAQFLDICGAGKKNPESGTAAIQQEESGVRSEQVKFPKNRLTVLKVGHHGSKNGTSRKFLELLNPRVAVISCGENNRYHHPSPETLERLEEAGAEIYRTDQYGAVTITVSGDKWMIGRYSVE